MSDFLNGWAERTTQVDLIFVVVVAVAATVAALQGRRGGRFRELPGWAISWVLFGAMLMILSHAYRWLSFTLLGLLMYALLRTYFYVAPVRGRDRYAILGTYLAIPVALLPAYRGQFDTFLALVPVILFLFIPMFLSVGRSQAGFLDSVGRTLLGVLFFVFSLAHLGLLVHKPHGYIALFGILVLASELPQRLAGRFRPGGPRVAPTMGIVISFVLAIAAGYWIGPMSGLADGEGARAGALVVVAVSLGRSVANAVATDLQLFSATSRLRRGAFLNRMVPAVYAAPVFFHYVNHFA